MNATDELRALLDARGVGHDDITGTFTDWKPNNWTRWCCADGKYATYSHCEELDTISLVKYGCTPEQAIAATLGRGTCKNKAPGYLDFLCSECGFVHYIDDANCTGDGNEWKYCPKCGCEVE